MEFTIENIMENLKSLGDEKRFTYNKKQGVGDNQFGITLGKLRPLAKKIKTNHQLALELWNTENYEARILSAMLLDPKKLTEEEVHKFMDSTELLVLVDELIFHGVSKSYIAKDLMKKLLSSENEKYERAGWDLAITLNSKNKLDKQEMDNLLEQVEANLKEASDVTQFAMNRTLCEIGIKHDDYTERCIQMGEKLGVYKDIKVAKGCYSSYAPEWIKVGLSKRK
ncbi:DNA alkylation repair protein [Romboutsia weinsteinii]|uniref:DNA alkylation repair protein n=1 Tax=Romboutsia weinsteinii TaxID=2020949 RepID=A0A371J668_9FIRM|nr:DNA alkylation repair protein [Romboutsia weinsteinii]RDY28183.1 DNA alkylation repair protein [Romboutsia weinsteinii]